jgi:hypothetical protein
MLLLDAPAVDCDTGCIGTDTQLPRNFRTTQDPFLPSLLRPNRPLPKRGGLDTLNASGSAQFSIPQLQKVLARLGWKKILFLDLRQEPHGFLNKTAVSWYGENNALNSTKSLEEIKDDEKIRLANLLTQKSVLVQSFSGTSNTQSCPIEKSMSVSIKPETTATEETQFLQLPRDRLSGYSYLMSPTPDHQRPTDAEVDRFTNLIKILEPDTWIHFHCKAGRGRTTTFMVLYDMLKNGSKISATDILERQKLLGGADLFDLKSKPDPRRKKWAEERLAFLYRFYEYCRQEGPEFKKTWSKWNSQTSIH